MAKGNNKRKSKYGNLKHGDVRSDGHVFVQYMKKANSKQAYEVWLSPEMFSRHESKMRKAMRDYYYRRKALREENLSVLQVVIKRLKKWLSAL